MTNKGKIFEQNFAKCARDQGLFAYRIKDQYIPVQKGMQYGRVGLNPCDYFIMSPHKGGGYLFALELKSTQYRQISIQKDPELDDSAMIKYHQIQSLINLSQEANVVAGFIFNYRLDDDEYTYFMRIEDFSNWFAQSDKKSINRLDITMCGGIRISNTKKRVHYNYDVAELINSVAEKERSSVNV